MLTLIPVISFANETNVAKPTSAEAKKVIDYYLRGTEGPALLDVKLCLSIRETENRPSCEGMKDTRLLPTGDKAFLWMSFYAPQKSLNNIELRWSVGGTELFESHVSFEGELMHEVPFAFTPKNPGVWKVKIFWVKNNTQLEYLGEFMFGVAA